MRKSEDIIQTKYNSQRTREDNIIASQLKQIREKLNSVQVFQLQASQLKQIREKLNGVLFCYEDSQLEALESIYRNLGKALEIINSNK
jgi:hypothetical protein